MDGQSGFDEGPGEVNLVARVQFGIAVAELDMPHLVLTRSADTGETSYSGPYETGLKALAAAEAEWQVDYEAGGRGDIRFLVAALYPPLEVTTEDAEGDPAARQETVRQDRVTGRPGWPIREAPAPRRTPRGRSLVTWLRDSIERRRVRPCRQCRCAHSRVVLAAGSRQRGRR